MLFLRRIVKFVKKLPAFANRADAAGGRAENEMKIGNALCDDRTHSDHRPASDFQIVADNAARADGRAFSDQRRQSVFVRLRRS